LRQNLTVLRAWDRVTGRPPDLEGGTPPLAINASLRRTALRGGLWLEIYASAAGRQERLSSLGLADRRTGAARSQATIAAFFRNGARMHGLISPGADGRFATADDLLIASGETLEQVRARVLGGAASAPMFAAVPGYVVTGVRASFRIAPRSSLRMDFSNLLDRNYRGIGWGVDGPGRGVALRLKHEF
jgi:hemoglobin/transferrin/lactoferrin receptor protein